MKKLLFSKKVMRDFIVKISANRLLWIEKLVQ